MKKRIFSMLLIVLMIGLLLPVAAFADVTSLDKATFTVGKNEAAGLNGDVKITFKKSGSNYNGTLYLPGGGRHN